MIKLIKCTEFKEYILSIQSFQDKGIYPVLDGKVCNKLLSTLNLEKIDYKLESFDKTKFSNNILDLEYVCNKHNSTCNSNNVVIAFKNQYMYSWVAYHHARLTGDKMICQHFFGQFFTEQYI